MGEKIGVLKVIVVQGKRLVIRDFTSSDPYVILKLENQVNLVIYLQLLAFFLKLVVFGIM